MKYLLGIAAIICCIILSTFDTFLDNPIHNVAYWGIVVTVIYMVLSTRNSSGSSS